MRVHVVFSHPSHDSFTWHALQRFLRGLRDAGHTHSLSDLDAMGFQPVMGAAEYRREAYYDASMPIAADVAAEQAMLMESQALALVYPVFWTEVPARLVGWFDRVWTIGFAYRPRTMPTLDAALCLCVAGHTEDNLRAMGHLQAMETVMLSDRIYDRARHKRMVVLGGTARQDMATRLGSWEANLLRAYDAGQTIGRDTKIALRPYKSTDDEALVKIFQAAVHAIVDTLYTPAQKEAWAPAEIDSASWCAPFADTYTVVAEAEGAPVGFGNMDACGTLDRLYVHPSWQGQGIARRIAGALEAHAAAQGQATITTHASHAARPFFLRQGYRVIRENAVHRRRVEMTNWVMVKTITHLGS